ncbi:MAG: 1-phosphofructokinase [Deltaproteobacteria bacterium]|nr:1-phosphofructokinase [Deltaproteobacteria bacterium]
MIVTVTLNPAIDQTIRIDRLVRGAVHRASSVHHDAGGKGVNVAACLGDWGVPVTATGLVGRDNAAAFEALFAAKGVTDAFVRADGLTRVNTKLVDDAETTDINLPGLAATPAQLAAVTAAMIARLEPGAIAVIGGSLPGGCPDDHYAGLVRAATGAGARVVLDASGPALAAALAADVRPWCIKPNRAELAAVLGAPLTDLPAVIAAARALNARGIALVVVSMGEGGALFVDAHGALLARLAAPAVVTTVGAGDAMVAGIVAAVVEGGDLARIARLATAFAVGKLGNPGPHLPSRDAVAALAAQVTLTDVEAL